MKLLDELRKFGISGDVTRPFSANAVPELVNYLDLLPNSPRAGNIPVVIDGAVEHDNRPVLYYLNNSRLSQQPHEREKELANLNRSISSRGDRAYLAVVKQGLLEVSPIRLGDVQPTWQLFDAQASDAINFYSNLVHGKLLGQESDDPDLVFEEMYKLLLTGADRIAKRIGKDNVLSLVGRALFFRFLCDRKIVTEANTYRICPVASDLRACFDNSQNAYYTSKWLDETFNGHFLPLRDRGTQRFFEELNRSSIVFSNLQAIVRGLQPVGDNEFQYRFDWAVFDFAHVPVGLLSQVYEAFSWKWEPEHAEETSVHYTPRNVAITLVEEAFEGLTNAAGTRVLDPACGGGVFLVLAFRRLYLERWRQTGIRPDTSAIREILEKQLCGFDISESALRLSALSLYLTAIELDPNPLPPEKLRFKDLDGLVLFNHRMDYDPESGPVVGSIREDLAKEFDSQFDLILCNPPWSRIDDHAIASELDSVSKQIVSLKSASLGKEYQNPRGEPDLPFFWRSTEWCRPGGQIAMVLPSRILFRQGDIASQARKALFTLSHITGIVNCSNVRKTNAWPNMDQPFMLVFARNELPADNSRFWFVSPQADFSLNRMGDIRIDSHSAHVLEIDNVLDNDWFLKSLAIGTWLDVEVVRKILSHGKKPLGEYWESELNLTSRQGYSVEGTPQKDASLMKGLLDAGKSSETPTKFTIIPKYYEQFTHKTLRRHLLIKNSPDPLRVYRAPLLLLRQSLPNSRTNGNALSSYVDIAYNKSFYGYSAHGATDPITLTKYLLILAHTNLWFYFALCVSAKLGFERTYFYKEDFDFFPIIPIDALSSHEQTQIAELAGRLEAEDETVFEDIDALFGKLYGLTQRDLQVIEDTLTVRSPHDELGVRGSTPPTEPEIRQFCSVLRASLAPFARKLEEKIVVKHFDEQSQSSAFGFLAITAQDSVTLPFDKIHELMLNLADQAGASAIFQTEESGLLIGIINQYRYWTRSRARLLAADILRDYFSIFEGAELR